MLLQYGEEDILYGTLTFYLGGETVEAIAHTALDCQCHEYDASSELWHRTGGFGGSLTLQISQARCTWSSALDANTSLSCSTRSMLTTFSKTSASAQMLKYLTNSWLTGTPQLVTPATLSRKRSEPLSSKTPSNEPCSSIAWPSSSRLLLDTAPPSKSDRKAPAHEQSKNVLRRIGERTASVGRSAVLRRS